VSGDAVVWQPAGNPINDAEFPTRILDRRQSHVAVAAVAVSKIVQACPSSADRSACST
jgi:hypothetical protein